MGRHGDHICALYDDPAQQIAQAAQYLADGIRRGERCFYCGPTPENLELLRLAVSTHGIATRSAVQRRALILKTHAEVYLAAEGFKTEEMLAMLNNEIEAALTAGFSGLRTCGDMSWLLQDPAGATHVIEYEALVNDLFRGVPACGMCQYDRRQLPAGLVKLATATHPTLVVNGVHTKNPSFRARPAQ